MTERDPAVLPEELLKKVRRIEITTRRIVDDVVSGQYRSHFKGHGVQFSEHRLYIPGDDVRHIDWKVSARTRDPLVKKFEEERELTVFLVVDVSASEGFSSSRKLKSEVVAELGGMLAFAATQTGDRVGALLFTGEIEQIIPPRRGRSHVLRLIRDLLSHQPRHAGTNLAQALEAAGRIMKHSGVVFVLSDFLTEGYEIELRRLARRHDVVALWVTDERESAVPDSDMLLLTNPETGEECWVDTRSYAFRKWLEEFQRSHEAAILSSFRAKRVEHLRVLTKEDYGEALVRFFGARRRRRQR